MMMTRADAPICCEDWCGGVMAVQRRGRVRCLWCWRLVTCAGSGTAGVGVRGCAVNWCVWCESAARGSSGCTVPGAGALLLMLAGGILCGK